MTMTELSVLQETESQLLEITENLFADPQERKEAQTALVEIQDRIATIIDRQSGKLLRGEEHITIDQLKGIKNEYGYIEPDLLAEKPLDKILEPALPECPETCPNHEQLRIDAPPLIDKPRADSLIAGNILHYPKPDDIAATLAVDAIRSGQLHSQLVTLFGADLTASPLGSYCWGILIENAALHEMLRAANQLTNETVAKVNLVHKIRHQAQQASTKI